MIAAVDLALLLYYFMKLGHLLTLYVEGYELQKQLLEGYLGEDFKTANAVFRKSTNFYVEAFFSLGWTSDSHAPRAQSPPVRPVRIRHFFWPYMLVTTIIVSVAQAAALFLVSQAYGWASVILFFGCAVIVTLYFLFLVLEQEVSTTNDHSGGVICGDGSRMASHFPSHESITPRFRISKRRLHLRKRAHPPVASTASDLPEHTHE